MDALEKTYQPFNFSSTRCYVAVFKIAVAGYFKIDHKLPSYITKLKGIFVSVDCRASQSIMTGGLTLNFNGQALKNFQIAVPRTRIIKDCSHPITFDEVIKPNSIMQGYYFDLANLPDGYPYTLSIYLHYEP